MIETENLQQKIDYLALKRLKVLNENGEQINFTSLWEDRKVIIIFVRHFSCIACRAHVDQIWNKRQDIDKKKTKIIFIGNGEAYVIKSFKEILGVADAEIYTDPTLETFDACGLKRGLRYLINIKSAKQALRLKKQGYSQGAMESSSGTHRQMGGIVIFKHPGTVLYHYTSEYLGDFDDPNDWL